MAAACAALLSVVSTGPADASPPACAPNAGNTGLSAAVVARAHQRITHRTIHTNCDIGIYVGAGATGVTIDHVTVSGAHFQGIFADKTSHVTIVNSTVRNNGWHTFDLPQPPPGGMVPSDVSQAFGISLFGVSDSVVRGNRIYDNGRGGIGIMDNGPNNPGARISHQNPAATLVASTNDEIINNRMWANYNGCGLVAATQNLAGRLSNLLLAGNTVTGTGISPTGGPDIGGIVVAADPPNSTVHNVLLVANTVSKSFEGGLIVNAEAPGSSTRNVWISGNRVTANNTGHLEAPNTAGIIVNAAAPGAENLNTWIVQNQISKQFYGIWSQGSTRPVTLFNHIRVTPGGTPIHHQS